MIPVIRGGRWLAVALVVLGALVVSGSVRTAQAQVNLRPAPRPGTTRHFDESVISAQTLNIMGTDIVTRSETGIEVTTETLAADGGGVRLKMTTDAMVTSLALGDQVVLQFDSKNPAGAKATNPLLEPAIDAMKALLGQPLVFRLNGDGKATDVDGIDAILKTAPDSAATMLKDRLKKSHLLDEMNQQLGALPDTPVKKGDKWQRAETWNLEGGQSLTFDRTYEYAGTINVDGRMLEQITVTDEKVRYAIGENSMGLQLKASELKVDDSTGELLFDLQEGVAVSRRINTTISGDITLLANGAEVPATLKLSIERGAKQRADSER